MSSPCPPVGLFLRDSLVGKEDKEAGQAAPASPVRMSSSSRLITIFAVLASSRSSMRFLLSLFIVVLSFSCPFFFFFWSCSRGVLPSCCPVVLFGVVRSQLVLLLSSWCVRVVFLPCPLLSSSCLPLVFLLSCCCRAVYAVYAAFRGRVWGHPQQQFLPTIK